MEKIKILEFDGKPDGWREWKAKTVAKMRIYKLWDVLSDGHSNMPAEGKVKTEWTAAEASAVEDNDKAYSVLLLSCQGSAFTTVESSRSTQFPDGDAYLAWKNLLTKYEDTELPDVLMLRRDLTQRVLEHEEETDKWIDDLEYIQRRLREAGATVSDDEIIAHILQRAPRKFSELVTILEMVPQLTLPMVRKRFRAFQRRITARDKDEVKDLEEQMGAMAAGFKGRCYKCGEYGHPAKQCKLTGTKCFKCGKIGHIAKKCPKSDKKNKEDKAAMLAYAASVKEVGEDAWLLDSGATKHMTPYKHLVLGLKEKNLGKVIIGNGGELDVKGIGHVDLKCREMDVELSEVYWVPDLCRNLLSMTTITQKVKLDVDKKRLTVKFPDGRKIAIPYDQKEQSYVLNVEMIDHS